MLSPEQVQLMVQDIEDLGLEGAAALYGMSVEEFKAIQPIEEYLDKDNSEGYMEILDQGNQDFEDQPIESELFPGEGAIADLIQEGAEALDLPPEAGLAAAGLIKRDPKMLKKSVDGMLTPKPKVKPLSKERKVEKEGVKDLKKQKEAELKKNKQDAAKSAAATTAAVTALGLAGDREEDGSLKVIDLGRPEVIHEDIRKEEPKVEEVKDERPGWYQPEGSNVWTVDTDHEYWQTDEGAAEATEVYGELPSWAKQPEVQELDLSAFSNWFK